jgi:hypothetical protein
MTAQLRIETVVRLLMLAAVLIGASPSPARAASPLGWQNSVDGFFSLVDQATSGSGTQPPEGPGFAAGSPLSPMTPYDTFSSAPMTPGVAGIGQFTFGSAYSGKKIKASLHVSVGGVTGSITNAVYWSENLLPALNPHLGSQALPFRIVFPTHAGQDDASAAGASIDTLVIGAANDSWNFRAGYFDLNQSDKFVFVQPALTNQTPAVALAPAESLGTGAPTLADWPSAPVGLPLYGLDVTVRERSAAAEVTNATLPSLPGTSVRINNASIFLDRGSDTEFSAQFLHLTTGGNPISTTTLFGSGATVVPSAQGLLPLSTLGGQTSSIAGLHGNFRAARSLEAALDYGRAWYDATHVFEPGTAKPGNYWRAGLQHPLGSSSVRLDAYRFEPRYSTAILPYGVPENIWSCAWSWPGVWLKSTYQLADNTVVGANRQGYRVHFTHDGGQVDVHASFAEFHQIDPASFTLSHQVGFVEGFFLPEQPGFLTLGKGKQIAAWLAWHPHTFDVTFDFVDDMMHRDAAASQPQDAVSYEAPQTVVTVSKAFKDKLLGAAGFGRYAMIGSWAHGASTNVNYQQDVVFVGSQYAESAHSIVLVQLRHATFSGLPSIPDGPSPDFHGTLLVVEQRFHY